MPIAAAAIENMLSDEDSWRGPPDYFAGLAIGRSPRMKLEDPNPRLSKECYLCIRMLTD